MKTKVSILIATFTLCLPLMADTSLAAKTKPKKLPTQTYVTSKYHDETPNQFVLKYATTAYSLAGGEPSFTQRTVVPKNSRITVLQKSGKGAIISAQGFSSLMNVKNISGLTYSTKTYKVSKTALAKLNKQTKAWAKQLSKAERKSIDYYSGTGYTKLNNYLRYGDGNKTVAKNANLLTSALQQYNLKTPMTVYRGVSTSGLRKSLNGEKLRVGALYDDPGFSSTSISRYTALGFGSKLLLKIQLPKGNTGAYIDPVSYNVGEKEFLINPGANMIVTKVQTVTYTVKEKTKGHQAKTSLKDKYKLISVSMQR